VHSPSGCSGAAAPPPATRGAPTSDRFCWRSTVDSAYARHPPPLLTRSTSSTRPALLRPGCCYRSARRCQARPPPAARWHLKGAALSSSTSSIGDHHQQQYAEVATALDAIGVGFGFAHCCALLWPGRRRGHSRGARVSRLGERPLCAQAGILPLVSSPRVPLRVHTRRHPSRCQPNHQVTCWRGSGSVRGPSPGWRRVCTLRGRTPAACSHWPGSRPYKRAHKHSIQTRRLATKHEQAQAWAEPGRQNFCLEAPTHSPHQALKHAKGGRGRARMSREDHTDDKTCCQAWPHCHDGMPAQATQAPTHVHAKMQPTGRAVTPGGGGSRHAGHHCGTDRSRRAPHQRHVVGAPSLRLNPRGGITSEFRFEPTR
jgi:hypothetical protein